MSDPMTIRKRKGSPRSEATKKQISEALKGKPLPEQTRRRMSEAAKGKPKSEEWKRRVSNTLKGKKRPAFSAEWKQNLSDAHKWVAAGSNHSNWQGVISFEPCSSEFHSALKRVIRERDDYVCQLCGKVSSRSVHHIDYDKQNSDPENLITLCVGCNAKVNGGRSFWTGYFVAIMQGGK